MMHNDLLFTLFFVGFGALCLFLALMLLMERRYRASVRERENRDGIVFIHQDDCDLPLCPCAQREIAALREENKKFREESAK